MRDEYLDRKNEEKRITRILRARERGDEFLWSVCCLVGLYLLPGALTGRPQIFRECWGPSWECTVQIWARSDEFEIFCFFLLLGLLNDDLRLFPSSVPEQTSPSAGWSNLNKTFCGAQGCQEHLSLESAQFAMQGLAEKKGGKFKFNRWHHLRGYCLGPHIGC